MIGSYSITYTPHFLVAKKGINEINNGYSAIGCSPSFPLGKYVGEFIPLFEDYISQRDRDTTGESHKQWRKSKAKV
ncbi:Hypothetical predicted protein [Octopus vulgaris]|uniref:Uncharacterized protein n=1 Tax=Octopus vulgaris TaxID=6645 RepID=A0AA36BDF1_OCTVU|nr:Hypothetical predicted protein [Octopus vulgaris]